MLNKTSATRVAMLILIGLTAACDRGGSSASGGAGGIVAPAAGTFHLHPERIALKDGGFAAAERGVMFVPLNRQAPGSGVIGIEVYRFKAVRQLPAGTPPIFVLHGGPNFQGLHRSLSVPGTYERAWRPFLDHTDVVVVSQRGIGASMPNTSIDMTINLPMDRLVSDEELAERYTKLHREGVAFWEAAGLDLKGFTVLEAASDIDDVRKALGYSKIVLWGGSFGSHWGMTLMRFHPDIVARAVLWGIEGPDHTYDMPSGNLNVLRRVAAEAESSPRLKGLIPPGGLIEALRTVIARVEKEPVLLSTEDIETGEVRDVLITARDVRDSALGFSGGLPSWPADVISIYAGDYRGLAARKLRRSKSRTTETASYYMLDCGSGISPARLAQLKADPAREILGDTEIAYLTGCPHWKSDLGDAFRKNFDSDIPIVMINGNWDTSTPVENAMELAPHFQNGKLIVVNRGSHGAIRDAFRISEDFRKALMTFVTTGDMSGLPDGLSMPEVEWAIPAPVSR